MKALLILAWRNDVGAYVLHSYPESMSNKVDGQDLMNLYNAHRFRSTDKNFQMMKRPGFNAASFYSGGYQSNYVGKPNYCITLLLDDADNAVEYEKVLIKVTSNLLSAMDEVDELDFEQLMLDIYMKLDAKLFDEIKVSKGAKGLEESAAPRKALATTSSTMLSEEEKIFQDLMSSEDFNEDTGLESKITDFEKSMSPSDPFSSGGAVDPFGGGAKPSKDSRDLFAENPFDAAQKPSFEKAFGIDEALGKTMFEKKKSTAGDIISRLDTLEKSKPKKPAQKDKDVEFKFLETMVGFLEEKVKILGTLATEVKTLQKAEEEKDQLIGKLLLLLKER